MVDIADRVFKIHLLDVRHCSYTFHEHFSLSIIWTIDSHIHRSVRCKLPMLNVILVV